MSEVTQTQPGMPRARVKSDIPFVSYHDLYRVKAGLDEYRYAADIYELLRQETKFQPTSSATELGPALGKKVGLGEERCPHCDWMRGSRASLRRVHVKHVGVDTGVEIMRDVACECWFYETLWQRWEGSKAMVDLRYQHVRLRGLQPAPEGTYCSLPLYKQREVIDFIQAHPNDNYVFCGVTGTAKTTYSVALFSHALANWASWARRMGGAAPEGCWRVSTLDLLKQHMDWNSKVEDAKVPMVTAEEIRAAVTAGYRPRLFLEELDKFALTDAKKAALFEILDAMYNAHGQIVVCSNNTVVELEARIDAATLRRIYDQSLKLPNGEQIGGKVFDFFDTDGLGSGDV